jgi:hypothetical protein
MRIKNERGKMPLDKEQMPKGQQKKHWRYILG